MKTHAKNQADELDRYLTKLQSGEKAPAPEALPESEILLLRELVALSEHTGPEAAFASSLERRLRSAEQRSAASALKQSPVWIGRQVPLSLAAAVILIVLSLLAFPSMAHRLLKAGSNLIAQLDGAPSSALLNQTPAGEASPGPSSGKPSPSAGTQAVAGEPTLMPTAAFVELPSLPQLATMLAGQYGGAGADSPRKVHYVLEATLPEGPASISAYIRNIPQPLEIKYIYEMAKRFGVQGKVYMPQWMVSQGATQAEGTRRNYIAIEDPIQILFEGTEMIQYLDRSRSLFFEGHWYPPQSLPPMEQAIRVAEGFLQDSGMLSAPYEIVAGGDEIRFYHILEDAWSLSEPYAVVTVSPDGQVSQVTYRNFNLQNAGEFPMLSSQEAWEILSSGEPSGRIWFSQKPAPIWNEWLHANPRFWAREYGNGQQADIFGPLHILYPVQPGADAHVVIDNLVLKGDLQPMIEAYQTLVQATLDAQAPLHVWGLVRQADGYQILQVEGWEPVDQFLWSGTIRREGDRGYLQMQAGESLRLPNLPFELVEGTSVFVNGGRIGDGLEWSLIQEMPVDVSPIVGSGETSLTAHVKQVELVYFVPPLDGLPPEALSDFGFRSLQPVWRFGGHTEEGRAFEAYVQAVTEAFIREAE